MTDDELAAIKARCDAATPGPWTFYPCSEVLGPNGSTIAEASEYIGGCSDSDQSNAQFIAHSRQDIPRLLSHIKAQAARIKDLEIRIQKEAEERRMRP